VVLARLPGIGLGTPAASRGLVLGRQAGCSCFRAIAADRQHPVALRAAPADRTRVWLAADPIRSVGSS
jgi:hypothetical protein